MKYTFIQKNENVMDVDMDTYSGNVESILTVHNPERLPLSILYRSADAPLKWAFQTWIDYRNIPATRLGIKRGFNIHGSKIEINAKSLKSLGLNLSDQYWFKPYSSNTKWDDVNFFQNDFSHQLTETFFGADFSPDYSTNGNLSKFWYIDQGVRLLAKAGKKPYHQQIFNEIVACKLLQKANLPHITYGLKNIDGSTYSTCPTFVSPDTEYIPANEIYNVIPFDEKNGRYKHFLACAEALEIPHVKPMLDAMLQFDYLINNTDRHMGNFGFIRDVNTLKILGMAPIFDNGNSLWFDSPKALIHEYDQQDQQIKLLDTNPTWIDKLSPDFIVDTITQEFSKHAVIGKERTDRIIEKVLKLRRNIINLEQNT